MGHEQHSAEEDSGDWIQRVPWSLERRLVPRQEAMPSSHLLLPTPGQTDGSLERVLVKLRVLMTWFTFSFKSQL